MEQPSKEVVFDAITSTLAELTVPERASDFGVRTYSKPEIHDVGVYGSPRWRLRQSVPDEGWELEVLPDGRLLSGRRPLRARFERSYRAWAEGSRAETGAAVLDALPPGRYLLVRSALEPYQSDGVLLGNEWAPSIEHMWNLFDERPFYAAVIGPESDRPPVTTHPLIALVALNYVGDSVVHGALFFDCVAREATGAAPAASGDLVLVIPVTGELVIDALAAYLKERSQGELAEWRDARAHELANALDRWRD